MTTYIPS